MANLHRFVIHIRIKNSIKLCNIFNIDKTSVWFDIAENITINPKEEKTVHVCRTGNEKNRFTIVLTCTADKKL